MASVVSLCICCCLISAVWSWKSALKDGDVILGGLFDVHSSSGPLTDCEKLHPTILSLAEAMIYAVEKVNSDPHLLQNITLGYDIRDYCYSSELAMNMTYDFVRAGDSQCQEGNTSNANVVKPVAAVVGPSDSQTSLLVTKLFGVQHIPLISPVSTSPELSTILYSNFYRTIPSDKWQTRVMADIVEYFNWTYIGLVALDDSYGRNAVYALQKEIASRGTFCLAFTEILPRLDYFSELRRIVKRLKENRNAKVVLVWLYGSFGSTFFQEVNKQKLLGYTWILSEGIIPEELFRQPGFSVLDGSLSVQPSADFDTGFDEHLKGINRQQVRHRNQLPWWDEFWRQAFNCSIKDGPLHETSTCPFNESATKAIKTLHSSYIPYCVDAVYALAHAVDIAYRSHQEQNIKTPLKAQDLGRYMKDVNFTGITGNVRFDEYGDPVEATYRIVNVKTTRNSRGDPALVLVGNWSRKGHRSNRSLSVHSRKIHWNPNAVMVSSFPRSVCSEPCLTGTRKSVEKPHCCWDCVRCPDGTISSQVGSVNCTECGKEEKSNGERTQCQPLPDATATLSSPSGLVVVAIGVCSLLLILWFALVMIKNYHSPVVKGSNRELTFVLLIAITASIVNATLNMQKPSHLWCRVYLPCQYLLCNICVSVLLLKTFRLLTIFQNTALPKRFKRCILDSKKQVIPLLLLQVTILVSIFLWLHVDPPRQTRRVHPGSHVFLVCRHFASWPGLACVISVVVYMVILCIICTVYAFKARKIPENFNEAKYIGFSMYTILLTNLVSKPMEFAMQGWYVTLISSGATLVSSLGLLGCMLAPKIFVILAHPEENTMNAVRTKVAQYSFESSNLPQNTVVPLPPVS